VFVGGYKAQFYTKIGTFPTSHEEVWIFFSFFSEATENQLFFWVKVQDLSLPFNNFSSF
jgi:hypothetical protein